MKKILTAVLSVVLCLGTAVALPLGFAGCGDDNTIVVGYTLYPPMNYMEDGELTGHDTELAQLVLSDKLGYEVEFKEIVWENKIIDLNSHSIDVIWNGMTITDELKESILITDPYMVNQQVLVTHKDNEDKFKTTEDLAAAKSIACERSSAADTLLTEMADAGTLDDSKFNRADTQSQALLEVLSNSSEAAVIDITMATSMIKSGTDFEDLVYIDIGFEEELYGIGLRKDDTELCDKINEVLAELEKDGTLDELYQKYLG